jgi:cell division protein FtsL
MSDVVLVAIIGMVPVLLGMMGKTASYLINLVQQQLRDTITAKNEELTEKNQRIADLESKLRKAGIDP